MHGRLTALVLFAVQVLKEMLPPHGPDVGIEMVSLPSAVWSSSSQHAALWALPPRLGLRSLHCVQVPCICRASAQSACNGLPRSLRCWHACLPALQTEPTGCLPALQPACPGCPACPPVSLMGRLLQVGMHYSKEKKHLLERKVGLETDPSDTVNEIIKARGQAALCDAVREQSGEAYC